MRYLIGIVFGLLIVFNWSSIKSYFDQKIDEQAGVISATGKTEGGAQAPQVNQLEKTGSEKKDLFKDFK